MQAREDIRSCFDLGAEEMTTTPELEHFPLEIRRVFCKLVAKTSLLQIPNNWLNTLV